MERSEVPRLFFLEEEINRIVQAIEKAEKKTSAEFVVRLERNCHIDPLERCRELLEDLELTSTKGRNGIIILITTQDHKAAIFGDEAVDRILGQQGWQMMIDRMIDGLKKGDPCESLITAISELAEHLQEYFPCVTGDSNELPNQPSYPEDH
jgi:uncharacterized membrane protein